MSQSQEATVDRSQLVEAQIIDSSITDRLREIARTMRAQTRIERGIFRAAFTRVVRSPVVPYFPEGTTTNQYRIATVEARRFRAPSLVIRDIECHSGMTRGKMIINAPRLSKDVHYGGTPATQMEIDARLAIATEVAEPLNKIAEGLGPTV